MIIEPKPQSKIKTTDPFRNVTSFQKTLKKLYMYCWYIDMNEFVIDLKSILTYRNSDQDCLLQATSAVGTLNTHSNEISFWNRLTISVVLCIARAISC